MSHHCHAIGCTKPVPPKLHMCLDHWKIVPKEIQKLIWYYYRQGQEIDKKPSKEYLKAFDISVNSVYLIEKMQSTNKARKADVELDIDMF